MVIAANSAGVSDAIGPSPSGTSLRGLDAVNLFLAGALSGFGPYVAAFLAEQKWTQQDIGFVLTAAGFAGLRSDILCGRASGVPDHQGPSAPSRAPRRSLWKNCSLLTFASGVFLFQMANASMQPLAGEALAYSKRSPLLAHRLSVDHSPPGDRGENGAVGRTAGEHVGPPVAAAHWIRRLARSVRWCSPGPPIQ